MSLPKRIGEFKILAHLGAGTYGVVYKCEHKSSTRENPKDPIAIKCVDRRNLGKAGEDNLVQEIKVLKALNCPHIVQLYDFKCDDKYVYMYMEFCSGGDLSQYIRQQRALPERITQHFLRQLGVALQFLFRRKIAHLDLKPHNLLLQPARDGTLTLKVADFGFAKKLYSGDVASSLRGSPLYMAPEMLKLRHYDARADLWSVGVIFFEALFGFAPFASGTYDELVAKILDDAPVVIPSVPALSPECIDLLKRLLVRDPDLRIGFNEFFEHPFVDIAHYPSELCLPRAEKLLARAVTIEKRPDVKLAYAIYQDALAYFIPALQYETDAAAKETLRKRITAYMQHAEQLRDLLKTNIEDRSVITGQDLIFTRVDLVSPAPGVNPTFTQSMQLGFDRLKEGAILDRNRNYQAALDKYQKGLASLMSQVNGSQHSLLSDDMIKKLRVALGRYMTRAEQLKEHLAIEQGLHAEDMDSGRCGIQ